MSIKKTILAVAAVGALTAATAVPAMALENEFHGMYKMKYFVSNLDNGSNGYFYEGPSATQIVRGTSQSAANYFEQRARLFYNAKANDDLKLVIAFEMDSVFGDRSQGGFSSVNTGVNTTGTVNSGTAFRNTGGALDTDAVNLETKWVYLDFNVPGAPVNVKVGTQAIKDSLKGVLFDVDAGGIYTSTKIGNSAKVNVGYFRGYEGNGGDITGGGSTGGIGFKMGVNNLDLVILEGKFNVTKDIAVGANYYGYFDYRSNAATILNHTVGLNADANVGPLSLSGFVAGQLGTIRNQSGSGTNSVNNATAALTNGNVDMTGIAANVTAKVKVGPGTAKLAGLYTSGDDGTRAGRNHSWLSLQQSVNGARSQSSASSLNSYNDSGMMLMNRNASAQGTTTDRSLGWTTNNRDQGLILATAGYDATLTPKLYANANVGFGWTSASRTANLNDLGDTDARKPFITGGTAGRTNASNFLGTEFNVETGYKLYDNLTASVQAAYLVLGGYYNGTNQAAGKQGTDPENPYTTRIVLSYTF
jgi:hypothetical protein